MRAVDRVRVQRRADRRQGARLGGIDLVGRHVGGLADRLQPGGGAVDARPARSPPPAGRRRGTRGWSRCRTDAPRPPRRSRARHTDRAIRATAPAAPPPGPSAPAARRCPPGRPGTARRSASPSAAEHAAARPRHRPRLRFEPRIAQHGAGQHVLRLGMRRHAEARHVDADDAHAVDLLRQQVERHAGGRRHAQVDDDDAS